MGAEIVVIAILLCAVLYGLYVYSSSKSETPAATITPAATPDLTAFGPAAAFAPDSSTPTAPTPAGPIVLIGVGTDNFVYSKTSPTDTWTQVPGSDGVIHASQTIDGGLIGVTAARKPVYKGDLTASTHWQPLKMRDAGWTFKQAHQRSDGLLVFIGDDNKLYNMQIVVVNNAGTIGGLLGGTQVTISTLGADSSHQLDMVPNGGARWCCMQGVNFTQNGSALWGASDNGSIYKKEHNIATQNDGNWDPSSNQVSTGKNPAFLSIVDAKDGSLIGIGSDNKTYTLSSIIGTPQATSDTVNMLNVTKWVQRAPVPTTSHYEPEPITETDNDYLGIV